jgi:signal transduction histidine kinase
MREFAEDVLVPRNIAFRLEAPQGNGDLKLGPEMRRQVFLIFKESIHNIVRHSDCTAASAELKIQEAELVLRVSDNGRLDFAAKNGSRKNGGQGLASMRRRAESLGGSLEFTSEGGLGFGMVLRAPLAGGQEFLALQRRVRR